MRTVVACYSLLLAAVLGSGCSGKKDIVTTNQCKGAASGSTCGDLGIDGAADSCDPCLCAAVNSDFCGQPATCQAAGASFEACGVPLKTPPKVSGGGFAELERSTNVDEYSGSGPVDASCFFPDGYPDKPKPSESMAVTVTGVAKIFSHGCQSRDLKIEIKKVLRGGADDGLPGDTIGTAVVTPSECNDENGEFEDVEDCTNGRYECKFEYAGVPTETELMIVTSGDLWSPIYEYGLFISGADAKDGSYDKDVRALAKDDYQVIAQAAMGKPITPGRGAVAGEVHDCGDVRLINAVVDVDVDKFVTTYFTDNEDSPLPDLTRLATSSLGLYAALDIEPGPVTVAAAGIVDGKLVTVGYFNARVFPNAVSSVTFRGLRPFQVP